MGRIDRILRGLLGILMIVAFFALPDSGWRWVFLIGLIPLFTSAFGTCPIYRFFGWDTRSR
ncbi:Protein of unknown function [Poseidonocella pacifica]|uniref:Inner membrane protein YgaP-like transmembrane domain-containing protein n=2 Tax=Poseidonocella pacifica TaxID=871651 RepID=A0A1I0VIX0_9RHOB|nr:Protein of unknown function [Poseidonocella pacifica]